MHVQVVTRVSVEGIAVLNSELSSPLPNPTRRHDTKTNVNVFSAKGTSNLRCSEVDSVQLQANYIYKTGYVVLLPFRYITAGSFNWEITFPAGCNRAYQFFNWTVHEFNSLNDQKVLSH